VLATFVATTAVAAEQIVIDDFDYPSVAAAQAAWVAAEKGAPVDLIENDGGSALRLTGDFPPEARRSVCDRQVDINLTTCQSFTFDLYVDDPVTMPQFTFYFRSGAGWYGRSVKIYRPGWQTVHFARSTFHTEGDVAGWQYIELIRLSAWQGEGTGGYCAVDNLIAHCPEIVVVKGTYTIARDYDQSYSAEVFARGVSSALGELGIEAATIGDEDVEAGSMARLQLAIFPYNPDISPAEADQIRQFIAGGGKVIMCSVAPQGLDETLGIKLTGLIGQAHEGQLNSIQMEPNDIQGLPEEVGDPTWRRGIVELIPGQAQMLGCWYDSEGNNTDIPALTLSDAGIFSSHVFARSGIMPVQTRTLLLALVGQYVPDAWPTAVQKAITSRGEVGHLQSAEATETWIADRLTTMPNSEEINQKLLGAQSALGDALARKIAEDYPEALAAANRSRDLLTQAYLLAHRSRAGELRALWNHGGRGAYGDWTASMKNLHESGFNAIMPNMQQGSWALYPSEVLPHSASQTPENDNLAQCVAAGQQYGVEVHPWRVNWWLWQAPAAFEEQMRQEGRLQADFEGNEFDWLCPSDPRNRELEVSAMLEMALKYDVDGVHFDYIRYSSKGCYCQRCRERFERDTGIQIENWPEDVREPGIKEAWIQWRCDQISAVVRDTAEAIRKVKPHCQISAAVFSAYPSARDSNGQDWVHWIKQGWLDFVCPMDYKTSDIDFAHIVSQQTEQVAGRIPLCPGIGAVRLPSPVRASRTAGQIEITRQLGTDGFIIFNYDSNLAKVIPPLGLSILREPTVPCHNAPSFSFDIGELTQQQIYGRHVTEGATVTATVRHEKESIAGRDFGEVSGTIVLQDADGQVVRELGPAPTTNSTQEVTVSAQKGLYRLAVVGEYRSSDGDTDKFVTRSLPIIFGALSADTAALF
jgi:uncharacterized lipoprotein YddW (UPF0748 family)